MASREERNLDKAKENIVGIFDRAPTTYNRAGLKSSSYFGESLFELSHIPVGARDIPHSQKLPRHRQPQPHNHPHSRAARH